MPLSLMLKVPARGVRGQRDRQRIRAQQLRLGERLEAQLLAGIGGVRDQLAQENFLVRIQRMNHQAQHLLGFGLELFDLWLSFRWSWPYNRWFKEILGKMLSPWRNGAWPEIFKSRGCRPGRFLG